MLVDPDTAVISEIPLVGEGEIAPAGTTTDGEADTGAAGDGTGEGTEFTPDIVGFDNPVFEGP